MEIASEAYDWQHEGSLEPITCAYCGRKGELAISSSRKQSAGDERDLEEATCNCICGARGVWSVVRVDGQRAITTVWTAPEVVAGGQAVGQLLDLDVVAGVGHAYEESKRLLSDVQQGLAALRQQQEELSSEVSRIAGVVRESTVDTENSAELIKNRSLEKLESLAKGHRGKLKGFAERLMSQLAELDTKLTRSHKLTAQRLQEYETKLLDPLTRKLNIAIHAIDKDVLRIKDTVAGLLASGSEPEAEVGKSLIVTEAQLYNLATRAACEAMSPLGIERLVDAYLERRRASRVNRHEMIENLPGLFDIVEGALRSWEDPTRQVPSEEVRAAVVHELQQLWSLVVDWQRHNGIDRFPEPGAKLDEVRHTLIADGSVIVPPLEMPDSVRVVLKSGYQFRDSQELLREAWVTATLKERQTRPSTPLPEDPSPSDNS